MKSVKDKIFDQIRDDVSNETLIVIDESGWHKSWYQIWIQIPNQVLYQVSSPTWFEIRDHLWKQTHQKVDK